MSSEKDKVLAPLLKEVLTWDLRKLEVQVCVRVVFVHHILGTHRFISER